MDSIEIRQCKQNDLPEVLQLLDAMDAEEGHGEPHEHKKKDLIDRMSEFFLVAEDNGCIIGFVIGERRTTINLKDEMGKDAFPNDSEYLEVQDLYVIPSARGCGIGTQLMTALLDRAHQHSLMRSMVYSANKDYPQIIRFYERVGYRMWHIFMTQ